MRSREVSRGFASLHALISLQNGINLSSRGETPPIPGQAKPVGQRERGSSFVSVGAKCVCVVGYRGERRRMEEGNRVRTEGRGRKWERFLGISCKNFRARWQLSSSTKENAEDMNH